LLAAAKGDPNGFVAGLNPRVTLDEIQQVPELFPVIKVAIDRKRQPGRFLLTGSANVMLLPKLSESLAGRMEMVTVWPFSQGEINGIRETFVDTLFSKRPENPPLLRGKYCWKASSQVDILWRWPVITLRAAIPGFSPT
jgi:predicted AAA+ superfamily ATPase